MSTVSVTYTHGADLDMLAVSLGSIMSSELLICRKIDTFVPGPRETGPERASAPSACLAFESLVQLRDWPLLLTAEPRSDFGGVCPVDQTL